MFHAFSVLDFRFTFCRLISKGNLVVCTHGLLMTGSQSLGFSSLMITLWPTMIPSKSQTNYSRIAQPISPQFINSGMCIEYLRSQYWKFVITAGPNMSELKLWNCMKWECVQTLRFSSTSPTTLRMDMNITANFFILADSERKVKTFSLTIHFGLWLWTNQPFTFFLCFDYFLSEGLVRPSCGTWWECGSIQLDHRILHPCSGSRIQRLQCRVLQDAENPGAWIRKFS